MWFDFGLGDGRDRNARGEVVLLGRGRKERSGSVRTLEVRGRRSGVENDLCCGVASKLTVGVSVSVGVGDGVAEGLVLSTGERVRTSLSS